MVALTAAPHVAAGYVAVRGYDVLDSVFADEEPGDVLASRESSSRSHSRSPSREGSTPRTPASTA